MSIFDKINRFLKAPNQSPREQYAGALQNLKSEEFHALFTEKEQEGLVILQAAQFEYLDSAQHYYHCKFSDLKAYEVTKSLDKPALVELLKICYKYNHLLAQNVPDYLTYKINHFFGATYSGLFRKLRKKLTGADLTVLLKDAKGLSDIMVNHRGYNIDYIKFKLLFSAIKLRAETTPDELPLLKNLAASIPFPAANYYMDAARSKFKLEVQNFNNKSEADGFLSGKTCFDPIINVERNKWVKETDPKKDWIAFVNHLDTSFSASKPPAKWVKKTKELVAKLPIEYLLESYEALITGFENTLKAVARAMQVPANNYPNSSGMQVFRNDIFFPFFKSFVHSIPLLETPALSGRLVDIYHLSTKKISGVGAVSKTISSSTIYAAAKLPKEESILILMTMERKTKYPSVRSIIEKEMQKIATKENISLEAIRDSFVPEFDLNEEKQLAIFGSEYKAQLNYEKGKLGLTWVTPAGKNQKSVPKELKDNFAKELKAIKKKHKDISDYLTNLKASLEEQYLKVKSWETENWKLRYFDHPVLSIMGKQLVWRFKKEEEFANAMFLNGKMVKVDGRSLDFENYDEVSLWHPIYSDQNEVANWREFLFENTITQPFKQAHREIYIVTDAERNTNTYSNRFASHILRQHVFTALTKSRFWKYTLMGQWDSHNTPAKNIPGYNMRIEFYVDPVDNDATHNGIYNFLATDQVRFYNLMEQEPMRQEEVPPMVFTELMRDVDMFVAVSSIGADPNWQDSGNDAHRNYWQGVSFGALTQSAKERKKLLERVVPMLKIREQCELDDKFLHVKGKLRAYKIHLGSGNILMTPNDQYLCIVAQRGKAQSNIFLPFEGDRMLSIILSKAFLLANDDTIKDQSIISQIQLK